MELYRLKSFAAIAREGNLTRAAERLALSQSALSSQLKLLEEELGLSLFRRAPRGMVLSEAGRQLLPLVEDLLEMSDRVARRARELRSEPGETLAVGLNADPGFLRVGAINRRLALLLGQVNVVFHSCPSVRTARQLRHGALDLAFFYGEPPGPGIRHLLLADVRFCIVLPAALARHGVPAGWPELAALPWIWVEEDSPPYQAVQAELERRRLQPEKAVKTVDEYIVKELVEGEQGLAVMREDEARPLVEAGRALPWERGWFHLPLGLAWLDREEERATLRRAREAIAHVWGDKPDGEGAEGAPYWF